MHISQTQVPSNPVISAPFSQKIIFFSKNALGDPHFFHCGGMSKLKAQMLARPTQAFANIQALIFLCLLGCRKYQPVWYFRHPLYLALVNPELKRLRCISAPKLIFKKFWRPVRSDSRFKQVSTTILRKVMAKLKKYQKIKKYFFYGFSLYTYFVHFFPSKYSQNELYITTGS